jgi:hypothetical protein
MRLTSNWRVSVSGAAKLSRRQRRHRTILNLEGLEGRLAPATLTVNSTADNTNDTNVLTLRDAITLVDNAGNPGSLGQATMPADWLTQINTPPNAPNPFGTNDTILFNIPTSDPGYNGEVFTIAPLMPLPTITAPVVINGFSQPGATPNTNSVPTNGQPTDNAVRLITLDGSQAGNADGLALAGGTSTVEGLVIQNFDSLSGPSYISTYRPAQVFAAIHIEITGSDLVDGNYLSQNGTGIFVDNVPNNTIGGTTAGARNIVFNSLPNSSSNAAILVEGPAATTNQIQGNYLGTDGMNPLGTPNTTANNAVDIWDASHNTVGGIIPGAGNVIWAGCVGVEIQGDTTQGSASYNSVEGNLIGTDATGKYVPGPDLIGFFGVALEGGADNNTIGGADTNVPGAALAGAGNVISGWNSDDVHVEPGPNSTGWLVPSGNQIKGNYIGCDVFGSQALSTAGALNVTDGVGLQGVNNTVAGNVISGNPFFGVAIAHNPGSLPSFPSFYGGDPAGFANGNVVQGNLIGLDATGTKPLPNGFSTLVPTTGFSGVVVSDGSFNNLIGGTTPGAANTIAFNAGPGVQIQDAATTGNRVQGNSIYENGNLGIQLLASVEAGRIDSVNLNAASDAVNHNGPNQMMNFPVLSSAYVSGGSTTVSGALATGTINGQPFLPNTVVTLDFYANSTTTADPTGYGPGQTWLGSEQVTTDATGNVKFTATGLAAPPAGEGLITATATDVAGSTSEFAANIPLAPASGGPYTVRAGDSLTLLAAAAGPGPWSYSWTINGQANATQGNNPTLTWAQLQALQIDDSATPFTVQAQATDGQGNVTPLPATTLTVLSATPTAAITTTLPTDDSGNSASLAAGSPITLTSAVTDPSAADTAAGFSDAWTVVKHPIPTGPGAVPVHTLQYVTRVLGQSGNGFELFRSLVGPPDGGGWVPDSSDSNPYLIVGFETPVYADGVTVWENAQNAGYQGHSDYNGFVTRIDALDVNGQYHAVWSGTDPTHSTLEVAAQFTWAQTGYLVKGLRIYTTNFQSTSPPGIPWNRANIDAVQLSGSYDPTLNGSLPVSGSYDPFTNRGRSDQYATTVLSADTSSEFYPSANVNTWSARQALGPPNVLTSLDDGYAWSPANKNADPNANPPIPADQTLALGFATPEYADGVTIRETQGNGFVTEVDVLDTNNVWHTVWTGTDPTFSGAPTDLRVNWPETNYLVTGVRIHLNTDHNKLTFEDIDSLQLHGWLTPGQIVASGTTPNLTFTPDATGTYFATLTATDSNGNIATTQTTIDVASSVPPTAHLGSPSYSSGQVASR